jgi:hypothetical protein
MTGAPVSRRPAVIDRALAWIIALLLGLMGVPILVGTVIAFFQPESGWTIGGGPLLLEGLALTYGALAILRQEYGIPRAWRPSLTQGFVITWYGGFSAVIVVALVRDLLRGGPELVEGRLGGYVAFWLILVGLPWILATLHDRRRRGAVGWVGRN